MANKRSEKTSEKGKHIYTLLLEPSQVDTLAEWCEVHGWEFYSVNYAHYAYRSEGVNLVVYTSGKLVVQGKNTEMFVTDVLEPEITKQLKFGLERLEHPEWFVPHAGMDESGKGDLFGPLVAACVIADGEVVDFWLKNGLKESKQVSSDARLFQMEKLVYQPKNVIVEVAYAGMEKYNQLYQKIGNLNELLAWFHAKAVENSLKKRFVKRGLLDQFTKANLVSKYLHVDDFVLEQHVRAESDPVVAAASIVARAEYVRQLKSLSDQAGIVLPKGAGLQAKEALKALLAKFDRQELPKFVKMHFKTLKEIQ